jgi:hypothetical protein
MPIEQLPAAGLRSLCSQLGATYPADFVPLHELRRRRSVPKDLGFGPDFGIKSGGNLTLVHNLATPALPEWVQQASRKLGSKPNVGIMILSPHSPDQAGARLASSVADQCLKRSLGLAFQSPESIHLVFPPRYRVRAQCASAQEAGHIPSWILDALENSQGFSAHLGGAFQGFLKQYRKITSGAPPSDNKESRLLFDLADQIAQGDPRLFFPLDRLHVLKSFESGKANQPARDHFFHTFNNLFLGFILLEKIFPARRNNATPDRFLSDPQRKAKAKFWESLWALTCLFHDPGYLAESPWNTLAFSLGVPGDGKESPPVPDAMKEGLIGAWDTAYVEPRKDLLQLFARTCGHWSPAISGKDLTTRFDPALRKAYFDGERASHSVVSGLSLIQLCSNDVTTHEPEYEKVTALTACELAALNMLFHDKRCRDTLLDAGVPAVPFEQLPYASILMFVDALQDDRRDIQKNVFRNHGVLNTLEVDNQNQKVTATVCLRELPVSGWPYRIAEYHSVTRWINGASDTHFEIDHLSQIGLADFGAKPA